MAALSAAVAAGPRTSGVLEGVVVGMAVTVLVLVSAGGRHATYAGELQSPLCSDPPTQQSQQGEPEPGHRAQSYCANAARASSAAAARASAAVQRCWVGVRGWGGVRVCGCARYAKSVWRGRGWATVGVRVGSASRNSKEQT